MSVKITSLQIENVKKVKMLQYEPTESGLNIIGGNNGQGKTSVLDAIAWALGGDKFRPSSPQRDGALVPPHLKITLSNGILVERHGKNSDLKVTDPSGKRAGQTLLNDFISAFALDVPRFMEMNNKEKSQTLLEIIGVGDTLLSLQREESEKYNRRTAIGQIADQKLKFAREMPFYDGVPENVVSARELIEEQQSILLKNAENEKKRQEARKFESRRDILLEEIERLEQKLREAKSELQFVETSLETARKTALELHDESTEELEESLRRIDEINAKVRANADREKAELEAAEYKQQYENLTGEIERVRKAKTDLLSGADLPLKGLFVEDGELTYKGKKWDSMSGAEQLKVSTAIVRRLNPNCGFVLLDKLEQMDMETLEAFGKWLKDENLQAIATRVSLGAECSIIIEDGMIKSANKNEYKTEWSEF